MNKNIKSVREITAQHASELFGTTAPVVARPENLKMISSAIMRRAYDILRENFPGEPVGVRSLVYKGYISIAQSIATDELAPHIRHEDTLKPMKSGQELRDWRGKTMSNMSSRSNPALRKAKLAAKRSVARNDIEVGNRAVKTEVRIPPVRGGTPKVYNQRQVSRCAEVLAEIAMKHDWVPPDSMVSLLMGYPLVNCRLARERLYDRGFYLKEGRNGAWRVLGRPDASKKATPNGLYTAEEVAALLEKVRKGEI